MSDCLPIGYKIGEIGLIERRIGVAEMAAQHLHHPRSRGPRPNPTDRLVGRQRFDDPVDFGKIASGNQRLDQDLAAAEWRETSQGAFRILQVIKVP